MFDTAKKLRAHLNASSLLIRILVSVFCGFSLTLTLRQLPLQSFNIQLLDLMQIMSFRSSPSRDYVVSYLPARQGADTEMFEPTRDFFLRGLEEIQKHKPKAIVAFLVKEWAEQVSPEDLESFFKSLMQHDNLILYSEDIKKYVIKEKPFSDYPRTLQHHSRSQDTMSIPRDSVSRRIQLDYNLHRSVTELFPFIEQLTGKHIAVRDFPYGFEFGDSYQIYIKFWPKGSLLVQPGESMKDKIVLLGFDDEYAHSHGRTPIGTILNPKYKITEYHSGLTFEPEIVATVLTNLTDKRYVKMVPDWINFTVLFTFSAFLIFLFLGLSAARDMIQIAVMIAIGNFIPFLVFWWNDWWLYSAPIALASAALPYVFLPIFAVKLIRRRDRDRLVAEQNNERIRAEAKLTVKNAESKVGFRLAMAVAHDIRSPLSALNLILGTLPADDERTEALKKVGARIEAISHSLLRSYRKSSYGGATPLSHSKSLVRNIQDHFGRLHPEVRLVFHVSSPEPVFDVSSNDLERHLFNLITNSIEAMQSKTTPSPTVNVEMSENKGHALIRVADNGPGVASEIQPRLFSPRASFGKTNGNGMALSEAKRFFESLGGSITLQDSLQGASFLISLPRSAQKEEVRIEGMLILVDDDPEVLSLIRSQIPKGQKHKIFSNPNEALEEIEAVAKTGEKFTLISDLIFNGYDLIGFDLLNAAGISQNAIKVMYTTLGGENQIQEMCSASNIRLIDKSKALILA